MNGPRRPVRTFTLSPRMLLKRVNFGVDGDAPARHAERHGRQRRGWSEVDPGSNLEEPAQLPPGRGRWTAIKPLTARNPTGARARGRIPGRSRPIRKPEALGELVFSRE
jgi:hypothetical protein